MQFLTNLLGEGKPPLLQWILAIAAALVALLILVLLYRVVFGRRVRGGGSGRARQPRLGVVDAYDLDRQRQLVLVRRDNVEHLIMIGGPNDVLIESEISRVQPGEARQMKEQIAAGGDASLEAPSAPLIAISAQQAPIAPVAPLAPSVVVSASHAPAPPSAPAPAVAVAPAPVRAPQPAPQAAP
ncbi:MAG: hypothetical protein JWO28_422, partial [Hyphomicrobiales bacterium]|nr:hypothetical protein [Hyphomicrobiales bacterium]